MVKSVRKRPINFQSSDEHLFAHEFEKQFSEKEVARIRNVVFNWDLRMVSNTFPGKVSTNLIHFRPSLIQYFKFLVRGRVRVFWHDIIIISDSWSFGYFHWLHDCLPRLLLVKNAALTKQVVLPFSLKKFSFVDESLELLGVTNYSYLKEGFLYFLRGLIFPVHLATTGNYNDEVTKNLRQLFLKASKEEPGLKVYISRDKSSRRKVANEAEILPILKQAGFIVIFCEDLSFKDQVELFSRVEYLVANHGAGISNILFMKTGTKLLELRAESDGLNNCYFSLASALDVKYYYQVCSKANLSEDPHTADIIVNATQLSNNLKLMLQDA